MPPPLRCHSITPSTSCANQLRKAAQSRPFSSTPQREIRIRTTRARRQMFTWLHTQGKAFLNPLPGSTNYLSAYDSSGKLTRLPDDKTVKNTKSAPDSQRSSRREGGSVLPREGLFDLRPFPLNTQFQSPRVLSEELREAIWEKIMKNGQSVRDVSAFLGVEMRRVAAVVRLKEVEKEWQRIGKPLARPYAKAVMDMLPKSTYDPNYPPQRGKHESINDLTIHAATSQQIFYPTSESRQFTRADAAKVFDETLLPADDRVPHPELALMHKDVLAGHTAEEIEARQLERDAAAERRKQATRERRLKREADAVKAVDTGRWQFRITNVNVDDAGRDGRGPNGVGWRYGAPLMDRSKGFVKIPTKVT